MATQTLDNCKLDHIVRKKRSINPGYINVEMYINLGLFLRALEYTYPLNNTIFTYIDANNMQQTFTINNIFEHNSALKRFGPTRRTSVNLNVLFRPQNVYILNTVIKIKVTLTNGNIYIFNIVKSRRVINSTESGFKTELYETYFDTVTKGVTVSHIVSSLYNIKTIITDNPANVKFSILNIPLFVPENSGDFPIPLNAGTTEGNYSGVLAHTEGLRAYFSMVIYPEERFEMPALIEYNDKLATPVIPTVPDVKNHIYDVIINSASKNTAGNKMNINASFVPLFPPSDFVNFKLYLSKIGSSSNIITKTFNTFARDSIYDLDKPSIGSYFLYGILKHNTDKISVSEFYIIDVTAEIIRIREHTSLSLLMRNANFFISKANHNSLDLIVNHGLLLDERVSEITIETSVSGNKFDKTEFVNHEYTYTQLSLTGLSAERTYTIIVTAKIDEISHEIGRFKASTIKERSLTSTSNIIKYNVDKILAEHLDTNRYESSRRFTDSQKQDISDKIIGDKGTLELLPQGLDRNPANNGTLSGFSSGQGGFVTESTLIIEEESVKIFVGIPDINADKDLIIEVRN